MKKTKLTIAFAIMTFLMANQIMPLVSFAAQNQENHPVNNSISRGRSTIERSNFNNRPNSLPPFPEDNNRPAVDWSSINWDQEISTPEDEQDYQRQVDLLEARGKLDEIKNLEIKTHKLGDSEMMAKFGVPVEVRKLVNEHRNANNLIQPNSIQNNRSQNNMPALKQRIQNLRPAASLQNFSNINNNSVELDKLEIDPENIIDLNNTPKLNIDPQNIKAVNARSNINFTLKNNEQQLTGQVNALNNASNLKQEATLKSPVNQRVRNENYYQNRAREVVKSNSKITSQFYNRPRRIVSEFIQIPIQQVLQSDSTQATSNKLFIALINWLIPTANAYYEPSIPIIDYYSGIDENTIDNLLHYLSRTQNEDGSWGEFNKYELTGDIALLLSNFSLNDNDQYTLAINYLKTYVPQNNREKAIKARLMVGMGEPYQAFLDDLLAAQNEQGGIGLLTDYESDILTTLETSRAFWVANFEIESGLPQAIYYIANNIESDGAIYQEQDYNASYYLINKTLEYFKPFQNFTIGAPDDSANISIQEKIDLMLDFLSNNYNETTEELVNSNDIIDELSILYSFKTYEVQKNKQALIAKNAKLNQNLSGEFGSSLYASVYALKTLSQSDLTITNIQNTLSLVNGDATSFDITIKNNGYVSAKNLVLYNFIDNFKYGEINLSENGFSLDPGEEVVFSIEFNNTNSFIGDTEFKFYVKNEDDYNYEDNWSTKNFNFVANSSNYPALPIYYIAHKYSLNGAPAINIRWAKKIDPNRLNYVAMYRKQGVSQWSYVGIHNDWSGAFLNGFEEDVIYEVTAGVLHLDGDSVTYFSDDITTIKVSGDNNKYIGNVEGKVVLNNLPQANAYIFGYNITATTDGNGNFIVQNMPNGTSAARVDNDQSEELWTKFNIDINATTTDVRIFSRLKEDAEPPVINILKIISKEDLIIKNQQEVELFADDIIDNIAIKEVDFYYYNPLEDLWIYLGNQNASGNQSLFKWYVPVSLIGQGYKIKAIAYDYQGNKSEAIEWGPFEIIDGTEPTGTINIDLTDNIWSLGQTHTISWEIDMANQLSRIKDIDLYYGNIEAIHNSDYDITKNSINYTLPLDSTYITPNDLAYVKIDVCYLNDNCSTLNSANFSIVDNTLPPHEPWEAPQEVGLALTGAKLYRTIINVFDNEDGSVEILYMEFDGLSSEPAGQYKRIVYRKLVNDVWQDPVVLKEYWFQNDQETYLHYESDQFLKDSAGNIHLLYTIQTEQGTAGLDSQDIFYLQIDNGAIITDKQISFDNYSSRDENIQIDDNNKVYISWREGYSYEAGIGTSVLKYIEKNENNIWSEVQTLTQTKVSQPALSLNNNEPVIVYVANEKINFIHKQAGSWTSPIIIDDYNNSSYNFNLFSQGNNIYDVFYQHGSLETNWKYGINFLRFQINNQSSLVINSEAIDLKEDNEDIKLFKIIKNSQDNYHLAYLKKDLDNKTRAYHAFFQADTNKYYFHTNISNSVMNLYWSVLTLNEKSDFVSVYFIGWSGGQEKIFYNQADFSQIKNYTIDNIFPENNASSTSPLTLEWSTQGGAIDYYNVLTGLSPNAMDLNIIATTTQANLLLDGLAENTDYYWQILGHYNNNKIYSNIWNFRLEQKIVNATPAINLTSPIATTTIADTFLITWQDNDPDNNAIISLYYDIDNQGNDGILIIDNLLEDDEIDEYSWDTTDISEGEYYVYAIIDDEVSEPVTQYSQYPLRIMFNQAPNAQNDSYNIDEDNILDVAFYEGVLVNDSDPDNDTLTVNLIDDVKYGSLTLSSNGSFTYTPNENYTGVDSFSYIATDGQIDSEIATTTITINAINDAPTINLTMPLIASTTNDIFNITWIDADIDDNATIFLYYDTDNQGSDGALIIDNISEDDEIDEYIWDTSIITEGEYYIYAIIDDGANQPVISYSQGIVSVNHNIVQKGLKKLGEEFKINTTIIGEQKNSAIAIKPDGSYVATWTSNKQDGSGYVIFAQRFDHNGEKVGIEFQVNSSIISNQYYEPSVSISLIKDDRFVISWFSYNQEGGGREVFAQIFNNDGTKYNTEFQINDTTSKVYNDNIALSAFSNQTILSPYYSIVWSTYDSIYNSDIYGKTFDLNNNISEVEFRINSYRAGSQLNPDVAGISENLSVAVWQSDEQDGGGSGIYGRIFDTAGNMINDEFKINSTTMGSQSFSKITRLSSGFVVIWINSNNGNNRIYGQRFDNYANKLRNEFFIQPTQGNFIDSIDVASLENNNFFITWSQHNQDSNNYGIATQQFNATQEVGDVIQVNSYTIGDQKSVSSSNSIDGKKAIIVWESENQDGSNYSVYGQKFDLSIDALINDSFPPQFGDWIIMENLTFEGTSSAPANVILEPNAILTINPDSILSINFNDKLVVKDGGKILIKDGGKIESFSDIDNNSNFPPSTGDWSIIKSITFEGTAFAPASVIIEPNAVLTIGPNSILNINLNDRFLIKDGGSVLIDDDGKILIK